MATSLSTEHYEVGERLRLSWEGTVTHVSDDEIELANENGSWYLSLPLDDYTVEDAVYDETEDLSNLIQYQAKKVLALEERMNVIEQRMHEAKKMTQHSDTLTQAELAHEILTCLSDLVDELSDKQVPGMTGYKDDVNYYRLRVSDVFGG